jgi:hypothetical protein
MKKFTKIITEDIDKEFRLKLEAPTTVGDLKKLLSNIDDDKKVIVYNSNLDSTSYFMISITNGEEYDVDDDIVLIYVD